MVAGVLLETSPIVLPGWTRSAPWCDNEWVPVRALCSSPTWAHPANSPASCLPALSAATTAQGFTGRLGAVCSGGPSLGREKGGFSGPCHGKPEADMQLSACHTAAVLEGQSTLCEGLAQGQREAEAQVARFSLVTCVVLNRVRPWIFLFGASILFKGTSFQMSPQGPD